MRLLVRGLSGNQQSPNRCFAKRFARFEPMKPFDQNEAIFVRANENGSLLSDF